IKWPGGGVKIAVSITQVAQLGLVHKNAIIVAIEKIIIIVLGDFKGTEIMNCALWHVTCP
ncbi:MAG: hypothetical protein J6Z11_06060, partial [Candidatus Riflebacteria bacterium]|nr:hypothetical protein [Candidatus Riflebacteria bacterium]